MSYILGGSLDVRAAHNILRVCLCRALGEELPRGQLDELLSRGDERGVCKCVRMCV